MKSIDDIKVSTNRLEKLKQATIVNYLSDIDLDNDLDLYDTMIHLFIEGKLDDAFTSPIFQDMDVHDRAKLQSLVRKYASLCFFGGNPNYWTDSIEGVSLMDFDLICMKILDNYHFLLEVAKDGGEDTLRQLKKFQDTDLFSENVVIDYLRNTFDDDKLLKKVLIDMSKKDGNYRGLSDRQKAVLFLYPAGVLYKINQQDDKEEISIQYLKDEVVKRISSDSELSSMSMEEIAGILGDSNFEEIISDIYLDYTMDEISLMDELCKKKKML